MSIAIGEDHPGRLSDDKGPRAVTFLAALPRNATGKVLERDRPGRGGPPA